MARGLRVALLLAFAAGWGSVLQAQEWLHWDPDWCWTCKDTREHFGASAGIEGALILAAPKWSPAARIGATTLIGAVFELGQADMTRDRYGPGYGFGVKDLIADAAGAASMELLFALAKKVFR